MNEFNAPSEIKSWLECLAWFSVFVAALVGTWRMLRPTPTPPAHPPNELLSAHGEELQRRLDASEREYADLRNELGRVRTECNDLINGEVGNVHNRVNEVLSACSSVQGTVSELSKGISELRTAIMGKHFN